MIQRLLNKHQLFVLLTLPSCSYKYHACISLDFIFVYLPFLLLFLFLVLFCIHTSHIHSPHKYYLKPFVIWLNHSEALIEKKIYACVYVCGIKCSLCMFVGVYVWDVCIICDSMCLLCVCVSQYVYVVYVHVCGMVCVFVCICLWHMYLCLCVCTWCMYVNVSVFVCGEVCGGFCDGCGVYVCLCVFVCMVCSVYVPVCGESLCVEVCVVCMSVCVLCTSVCTYVCIFVVHMFLCVICGVYVRVPPCVYVCVSVPVCVFTPVWGLQSHRSWSWALLSDLSICARIQIQRLPRHSHGLRFVSGESGESMSYCRCL